MVVFRQVGVKRFPRLHAFLHVSLELVKLLAVEPDSRMLEPSGKRNTSREDKNQHQEGLFHSNTYTAGKPGIVSNVFTSFIPFATSAGQFGALLSGASSTA